MAGRGWARVPVRGEERERERERGGDGCMDMDGYGWMVGRLDGLERRGKKRMGGPSLCVGVKKMKEKNTGVIGIVWSMCDDDLCFFGHPW